MPVVQRAEEQDLGSRLTQGVQIVRIVKTEGFIPRHRNAAAGHGFMVFLRSGPDTSRGSMFFRNAPRLPVSARRLDLRCQFQKPVQIYALFRLPGNTVKSQLKIFDFRRGQQAEMTALQARLFHRRKAAQHRKSALPLQDSPEVLGLPFGTITKQQAGNPAFRAKASHPADLRRQRDPAPLRPQHQNGRQIKRSGELPGAGLCGGVQSVIVAHGPFHQGHIALP